MARTYRTEITTAAPLVVGQRANGTSRILDRAGRTVRTVAWSGTYLGERASQHEDGAMYHYFTDGDLDGIPQRMFGFPVAAMSTTAANFQIGQTYRRAERGARAFIVTARDGLRIRVRDVADGWYF